MKLRNLMWGACACILATGCSNDDVAVENSNVITNADGESYMAVRIVAANDGMSRATSPGFDDGDNTEGGVTSAVFYFYDGNGNYVTKGSTASMSATTQDPADDNVERISNVVVVLRDVTETPAQVIAIVNGGESTALDAKFENKSLTQAMSELLEGAEEYSYTTTGEGEGQTSATYFRMSNSTYMNGTTICCATPLSTQNLQPSEDLSEDYPVDIYVERLAAKVQLLEDENLDENIEDVTNVTVDGTANQTLEITVDKWGLSAINKEAYYLKNLDNTWTEATLWSGWNASNYSRSYWAKDPNYSSGNYPTNYNGWNTQEETHWDLDYLTYAELDKNPGESDYCLENTVDAITLDYTNGINTSAVTHLLIAATMKVKPTEGEGTAQTLYRYKGAFYTEDNYIAAALSDWEALGTIIYTATPGGEGTTYSPLAATDVEIVNKGDGKVNIKLTDDAKAETWYTLSGEGDSQIATEYPGNLDELFNDLSDADGFKDGKMYYCVPIEHLNTTAGAVGNYGVVRNHWYQLTLESISGLGHAVYDPDEEIIPNYNPETYYVAARLNILSWKVVNQSVKL